MKTSVILKSTKIGVDGIRSNYNEPLTSYCKQKFADGVFLVDSLMGYLVAKEIEPGVYQSLRLP